MALINKQNNKNVVPRNAITVEEITNGFTNPFLPNIYQEPTFDDIQVTTHLLNVNVISVPSMAG
jgi:hypothetical protein